MKITTKLLKKIILEEVAKIQEYGDTIGSSAPVTSEDILQINPKSDGGWTLTGSFKGRRVQVDSKDSGESLLSSPPEQIRFALARTLLGYFYKKEGEDGLRVNEPMLKDTKIIRNGQPV